MLSVTCGARHLKALNGSRRELIQPLGGFGSRLGTSEDPELRIATRRYDGHPHRLVMPDRSVLHEIAELDLAGVSTLKQRGEWSEVLLAEHPLRQ